MKNLYKMIGIIALVAVIGFSMTACGGGGGGGKPASPPSDPSDFVTYTGVDSDDNMFVLKIESGAARAAYTPKVDDKYTLLFTGKVSTGTVKSFTGGVLTLAPSKAGAVTFTATVSETEGITTMGGTIAFDDGTTASAPTTLTPPSSAYSDDSKSIYIFGITGLTGVDGLNVYSNAGGKGHVAGQTNVEFTNGTLFVEYLWKADNSGEYTGSGSFYVGFGKGNDWYITKEKISITQAVTVIPWSSFGKWE